MNNSIQDLAPTKALGAKVIYSALTILKNKGGEMSGRNVLAEVEKNCQFE